jgi:hypothetical protein
MVDILNNQNIFYFIYGELGYFGPYLKMVILILKNLN